MTEISPIGYITLVLLVAAIGIFGSIAVHSKSVKSFQFQIAVVLIIWIFGEIIDFAGKIGVLNLGSFEELPSVIHMIAMVLIGIVFWLRFYLAKRSNKKLADDLFK